MWREKKGAGSQVVCEKGQLIKLIKTKDGEHSREVLTKHWSDWNDYWSVDFDYESKKKIARAPDGLATNTGDGPGRYRIAVKVVDIFGNDTVTLIPVTVS